MTTKNSSFFSNNSTSIFDFLCVSVCLSNIFLRCFLGKLMKAMWKWPTIHTLIWASVKFAKVFHADDMQCSATASLSRIWAYLFIVHIYNLWEPFIRIRWFYRHWRQIQLVETRNLFELFLWLWKNYCVYIYNSKQLISSWVSLRCRIVSGYEV